MSLSRNLDGCRIQHLPSATSLDEQTTEIDHQVFSQNSDHFICRLIDCLLEVKAEAVSWWSVESVHIGVLN